MNLSWLDNVKKFKFWRCPEHQNGHVVWEGDLATCQTCGAHNQTVEPDASLKETEEPLFNHANPVDGKRTFER